LARSSLASSYPLDFSRAALGGINPPARGVSFKGPLYPGLKVPTSLKLDV